MSNKAWVWLDADVLRAVHEEQLAEHGGASGTRDDGLFESALARPLNLAAYGEPDVHALFDAGFLQGGAHRLDVLVGDEPRAAAHHVHDAALDEGLGEHLQYRLRKASKPVHAEEQHVLHPTLL